MKSLKSLLVTSLYSDFETAPKALIVHISLLVCAPACFLLFWVNYAYLSPLLSALLLLISIYCITGLVFIKKIPFHITGIGLCSLLWISATDNLFEGAALHDQGLVIYPIFILFAGFLFDWRGAIPVATISSILSILLVYFGYQTDLYVTPYIPASYHLLTLSILFIAFGIVTFFIKHTWMNMLNNIRTSYDLTLQAMAFLLEHRDQETEGHSQRVVELSIKLAQEFGFTEDQLRYMRWGAYLHDLGKIAIPDAILFKKEGLDENEWKIMRNHPTLAKNALSKIPSLQPVLDIPYYHHERWDGSGYPEGLSGLQIPIEARIFAVVDTWDALTSIRPYRDAWTAQQALDYIRNNSGILFDPLVVSRFEKVISDEIMDK
ncbi:MAG: HD domain-containing protein [Anaerolineae bacterium]|nr:HD domain-containing protein [Anaerolineae bacterium]